MISARDEEGCISATVEHLDEIVVVGDGSSDATWELLGELRSPIPSLVPAQNPGPHGFGRVIIYGFEGGRIG